MPRFSASAVCTLHADLDEARPVPWLRKEAAVGIAPRRVAHRQEVPGRPASRAWRPTVVDAGPGVVDEKTSRRPGPGRRLVGPGRKSGPTRAACGRRPPRPQQGRGPMDEPASQLCVPVPVAEDPPNARRLADSLHALRPPAGGRATACAVVKCSPGTGPICDSTPFFGPGASRRPALRGRPGRATFLGRGPSRPNRGRAHVAPRAPGNSLGVVHAGHADNRRVLGLRWAWRPAARGGANAPCCASVPGVDDASSDGAGPALAVTSPCAISNGRRCATTRRPPRGPAIAPPARIVPAEIGCCRRMRARPCGRRSPLRRMPGGMISTDGASSRSAPG